MVIDPVRELGSVSRVIEPDRGPIDAFREDDSEEGSVGARLRGSCRIRRNPEAPSPCSCSVMMGDLSEDYSQPSVTLCTCPHPHPYPEALETRISS